MLIRGLSWALHRSSFVADLCKHQYDGIVQPAYSPLHRTPASLGISYSRDRNWVVERTWG